MSEVGLNAGAAAESEPAIVSTLAITPLSPPLPWPHRSRRATPGRGLGIVRGHDRRDHGDAVGPGAYRLGGVTGVDAADRDQRQRVRLRDRGQRIGADRPAGIRLGRGRREGPVRDVVDEPRSIPSAWSGASSERPRIASGR